jgi:hypothetical protein
LRSPCSSGPLVLSFIDCEQAFDSADRRVLAKVPYFYGIPDIYIKAFSARCENKIAAVKVGDEVRNWFRIESTVN